MIAVVLLALLGGSAACGGDEAAPSEARTLGPENRVKVRVGETAGIPTAFLGFGVQKGFFADEGIDLDVVPVQGAVDQEPQVREAIAEGA